jgi:hypothetical protein
MSNSYPSGSKKHEVGKGMERSPEQPESYVLRGGQAGAGRLRLINRVKWPTSERLCWARPACEPERPHMRTSYLPENQAGGRKIYIA